MKKTKISQESIKRTIDEIQASSLGEESKNVATKIITSYLYVIQLLVLLFSSKRAVACKARKQLKEWLDTEPSSTGRKNPSLGSLKKRQKKNNPNSTNPKNNDKGASESSPKPDKSLDEPKAGTDSQDGSEVILPPEGKGDDSEEKGPRKKRENGEYNPDRTCFHAHETLKSGDKCPECGIGKVYSYREKIIPIITGQPSLEFEQHHFQLFRCNACGEVFEPQLPENFPKKGTATASASAIAIIQHYYAGTPFAMMSTCQQMYGQKLSSSQIWEKMIIPSGDVLRPINDELIKCAAEAPLIYSDDTSVTILSCEKENEENRKKKKEKGAKKKKPEDRVATYSSGLIAILPNGLEIVLYFHGRQYAGENLADLLGCRQNTEKIPIQMKDASTMNVPSGYEVVEALCNSHALRKFKEIVEVYPDEVDYILDRYSAVFKWDAYCRKSKFSLEKRLEIHIEKSLPLMKEIKRFSEKLMDEHKVEPNSKFGKAIKYFIKHYDGLIAFCKYVGAPLENNNCERAIKLLIRRRKNSFFFKTEVGAEVAEIIQSIVYTAARYDQEDVYNYLVAVFENEELVRQSPEKWLPWNYKSTLIEINEIIDLSFASI